MRFWKLGCLCFLPVGVFVLTISCVSKTGPRDRFRESQSLSGPPGTVSVPDPDHFSFAVVGDLHIGGTDTTILQKLLATAAAENDSFFVFLGDIVDQGARNDVVAFWNALEGAGWKGKAYPVIGNHDVFNDGWSAYRDLSGPSHYTFTAGNSGFIAIDTADGGLGDEERAWLNTQLASMRQKHVFLLSHYLPAVPELRTYLRLADEREARQLMKWATDFGVTAWLGAHYHSYITGTIAGVTYVVAGGGGGKRMAPVTNHFLVQVQVNGDNVNYFLRKID